MSGMRRVGGNQVSKSKYAQKKEEDEEEIDFAQDGLYEETEKPDTATSKTKNLNIDEENATNENNQFERLNIDENIINNVLASEEGKNEEEIKINQNELVNAMKELEDVSNSSRDDSQISVNEERDRKSIILKNIDNSASIEDIEEFFRRCGEIKRVSIMFNKYTGHPKGYALVEFNSCEGKMKALELNNTILKGKQVRVMEKNRRTPNYILSKNKILNYHAYLNDNITKNKYEQDLSTSPVSLIGPMKARLITKKSFEPY